MDILQIKRHSCAHLAAAAIFNLFPHAKFGIGPVISNGFYYDFFIEPRLKEEDLEKIEKEMYRLKKHKLPFVHHEVSPDQAMNIIKKQKQKYKMELIQLLNKNGSTTINKEMNDEALFSANLKVISFYKVADFFDLCKGPHVNDTSEVGVFKLTHIAGAYWRGDPKRDQLQRIYGLCFETQAELEKEIFYIEESKKRDHRKIGKELKLFTFSEKVGAGLPLWLPNGVVLREELEFLAKQEEHKEGYVRVASPHIAKSKLFELSGHLEYYKEDMYAPMDIDGEQYYLKAMNCPHHHEIYLSSAHSYRDLPIKLAEYGQVYRYEQSGALSGLMRTRSFCQNDAHIYCREDQVKDEFLKVLHLHARYYRTIGIEDFYMRFSLPDLKTSKKYILEPEQWQKSINIIRAALAESGYRYTEAEGEAAFYGPKIDFMIKNVIGTEYAISTNQLDFMSADRFDLNYVDSSGKKRPVYVIHRAPLGSHERFIAFLTEHFAGAFPTWLAPIQIRIVPISERHLSYANQLKSQLFNIKINHGAFGLRIDVDEGIERMQKKIRNALLQKIPYIVVLGDAEIEKNQLSVRLRNGINLGLMTLENLLKRINEEISNRKDIS